MVWSFIYNKLDDPASQKNLLCGCYQESIFLFIDNVDDSTVLTTLFSCQHFFNNLSPYFLCPQLAFMPSTS